MTFGNGTWLAFGYDGNYYSTNGKTWENLSISLGGYRPCYVNGIWITGNSNGIYYSTNSIDWTQSNITNAVYLYCSSYANGLWVAGAHNGIYWSENGRTWNKANVNTSVEGVAYGNGVWLATGIYRSTDGKNWTQLSTANCRNVIYADGYWITGGYGLWFSFNGEKWIQSDLPSGGNILSYANGICITSLERDYSSCRLPRGLYYSVPKAL